MLSIIISNKKLQVPLQRRFDLLRDSYEAQRAGIGAMKEKMALLESEKTALVKALAKLVAESTKKEHENVSKFKEFLAKVKQELGFNDAK